MNQAEIEAILERHIRAEVYWTYRDETDLDPRPRAEWYGAPTAAREILKAQQSDLAAAQERLVDMRALLTELQWVYPEDGSAYCPICGQWPEQGHWDECRLAPLLSAAPAGRVLWRGKAHHREFCTLHLPREADDALGKPGFKKIVDVTVREAVTEGQGGE